MLAQIMTTRELAKYLRLHEITICKLCREGKIPSVRIGRVWRFDREVIAHWIARGQATQWKKAQSLVAVESERP